jgi:DNA replication factor GINS
VIEGVAAGKDDAERGKTAEAIEDEPTAASDRAPNTDTGTDTGAEADDALGAETPRADSDRAPEASEPPTEKPADDRATNSIADDVRAEETRNGPRSGNSDEHEDGKAEPMGVADAMGVPAGTASEGNSDADRETDGGVSAADGQPAAATGTGDISTGPSGAPESAAGAGMEGDGRPPSEDGNRATKADGEDGAPPRDGASEGTETTDRQTVRITRDVGEIVGIDERVYELASEDVVQLPAANAKPLVDRDAAERLE